MQAHSAVSDVPEHGVPGAEDKGCREELNVIDDSLRGNMLMLYRLQP